MAMDVKQRNHCIAAISWTTFVFTAAWVLAGAFYPPYAVVWLATWVRNVEPYWVWSLGLWWYEGFCFMTLAVSLVALREGQRGGILRMGRWLAVVNPFMPWVALFVQALLAHGGRRP